MSFSFADILQGNFQWILEDLLLKSPLNHSTRRHKLLNNYYSIIFN